MTLVEKYAFDSGRSCVKYFKDGSKILTGGVVGDIFVFGGIEETIDDEDFEPFNIGEEVLGFSISDEGRIFVAPQIEPGDKGCNEVLAFKYDDGKGNNDGTIAKFTAEATCVDVSRDGVNVVAGSADMTVQLINTETFQSKMFKGHEAPILNVALDPKMEYILSSSCDGTAKLWKIETSSCIKTWPNLWDESNDIGRSKTTAAISWHPQGDSFAIPFKSGVKLMSRDQEFLPQKLNCGTENFFSATAFSTNGNHLVGGTVDGKIVFWKLATGAQIAEVKSKNDPAMVCSIDWNPTQQDEIAFIKVDGYWGTVANFLKDAPIKTATAVPETEKNVLDEDNMDPDELAAALFDDDDDDDNENSFSVRRIKKETGFNEEGFLDEASNQTAKTDDKESLLTDIAPLVTESARPPPQPEVDLQGPFQPGSTPIHLESRFMVWNSVGIVKSFNSDEENSIDVEFHDASVHHPIHLGNSHGYIMADLSVEAVLMASEADEVDGAAVPSKLTCHNFGASGLYKEWSVDMPDKEDVMAICCGIGWVAAATDRRHLRIFSTGGMQREVLSLPGPIVAMSGFHDKLMVSVHIGMPLPGNQCIGTAIFNVGNTVHQMPTFNVLPLAPKSNLAWQGFTDEGNPCIMDSAGYIRLLNQQFGTAMWIQVCDSKSVSKGKSDHFFMVGANLEEFSARCILVKGSRYPATVPKPVITVLQLKLPLCGTENEKFNNEQSFWKAKIISSSIDEPSIKAKMEDIENEALLKLFAHACQLEQDARAMDICKLMTSQGLQLAITYASRIKRLQLASKISAMAYEKQEVEEQEQEKAQAAAMTSLRERQISPSQGSIDLFASQDDNDIDMEPPSSNPLLAAEARKESVLPRSFITPTPPTNVSRNPFKKSTTPSGSRVSLDDIAKTDVIKSGNRPKTAFGSKKIESATPPSRMLTLGKKKTTDKENKSSNQPKPEESQTGDAKGSMKGFLLYFEENSQIVSQAENIIDEDKVRDKCLETWKNLSSDEKKDYKTPRVPKRKRENDEVKSASSKLARFAAPTLS